MEKQIDVEMRVSSLLRDIGDLVAMRNDPATAHLFVAELPNLSAAMTGLQLLVSEITTRKPALRVVR
jgi:hypothetical protein